MLFNIDVLSLVMIAFIVIISYRIYKNSDIFQLKCIVSTVDGEKYCVREREKINAAADRLAEVNSKLIKVVNYCAEQYPNDPRVIRMKQNFNPKTIVETLPTSEFTAYSENKGEKIAFCLDKKRKGVDNLIEPNTLTYVALHELAHVATKSVGHPPEFWENFKFLLIQAEAINVYQPVDYKKKPTEYCGMEITDNPYYDN
tara:strand:+ start:21540 stop:22139 length:600 start_codon:yes stop_codon:yes gene_type:complete